MANDLISREAALEAIHNLQTAFGWGNGLHEMDIHKVLLKIPAVDAAPVVRCKECIYWMDRHVLMNDGTRRPFKPGEDDVTCDVGINCGSKCMFDAAYMGGNGPFRQKEDFCSRGVKKEDDEK